MSDDVRMEAARFAGPPEVFRRHPYSSARYGAYDANHVRVEQDGLWGLFTRNAEWLDGPLRSADPIFARWVTGKFIMEAELRRTGRWEDWS